MSDPLRNAAPANESRASAADELSRRASAALDHYLHVYFQERDLEAVVELLHPDMTGVGSGLGELAFDLAASLRLYEQDISSVPTPIHYTVHQRHFTPIGETAATGLLRLDLRGRVGLHAFSFRDVRLSVVLVDCLTAPKIIHMHISLPTEHHEPDEAYPLKEIHLLTEALEAQIADKTRTLEQAYAELERHVSEDALTGVLSRRKFEQELREELTRSNRYGSRFSLVMVDIDDFKRINDGFGHQAGDQVLVEFARCLQRYQRQVDRVGRWGGEEFLILLPETPAQRARQLAEHLRVMIASEVNGPTGPIRASFGVTAHCADDTLDSLFSRVDRAMYDAKRGGRDRVCLR